MRWLKMPKCRGALGKAAAKSAAALIYKNQIQVRDRRPGAGLPASDRAEMQLVRRESPGGTISGRNQYTPSPDPLLISRIFGRGGHPGNPGVRDARSGTRAPDRGSR